MAISLLVHAFSAGASGGSTTSAIDTTGANLIVVGMVYSEAHQPTLSDSNSNTWTPIGSPQNSSQEGVQLFYASSPTVGAGHTFTVTGASSFSSAFVQAFSGAAASSALDQNTGAFTNIASTSLATGSITPTQNNELIVVMYGNEGTAVGQAMDSGMTLTDTQGISGPAWGSSMGYKVQTTATAINVTGSTNASGTNSIVIASFFAPSANVNVNLTGVAGTGAANALTVTSDRSQNLTGVSGAGAANAIALGIDSNVSLSGVASIGAANAPGSTPSGQLAGVFATGQPGSLAIDNSGITLVGASASGAAGAFFASAEIVSLSVIGLMTDTLAIDAIASNRPVATSGTMRDTPVPAVGTLLAA